MARQRTDGSLPYIVPAIPFMSIPYSSAGWSDALANIPLVLHMFYGDQAMIREVYESVRRFVEFNLKRARRSHITNWLRRGNHWRHILDTGYHWGEWLEPGSAMVKDGLKAFFLPDVEVATAWLYQTTHQLSEMAGLLGKKEDAEKYASSAMQIRDAYRKVFLKEGRVASKRHCRFVRPVAMGLVEGAEATSIIAELDRMCRDNDYRIGTGFLTTYRLLSVLCEHGFVETAYRILENEKCPSWLYEVKKGATTTWENWMGIDEKNVPHDSHNHYAPGAVAAWFFSHCAGIQPLEPGFTKVRIRPYPGGTLTWAKASYNSCAGRIVSDWKLEHGHFALHVELPEEIAAEIILPDGTIQEAAGGTLDFHCDI